MAIKLTPKIKNMKINPIQKTFINEKKDNANVTFALDIGTRSVIGLIGYMEDEIFTVIDSEIQNHNHRCMIDGQIQDIGQVAQIVSSVKKNLEIRNNITLKDVSIAAAGRALLTVTSACERTIDATLPIAQELVSSLEMEAVENALKTAVADSQNKNSFYCVGHSIVSQTLDNYPISNLIGHKGEQVHIEIIAAFLPGSVVESLYSTMETADLSVKSITLEPIAAINALIPSELRMLNLALVDIGAGTSDIALSKDGSVVSYGMATVAGDELTEALIKAFLVDFQTAEKIKLSLMEQPETIAFTDILNFDYEKSYDDVINAIAPAMTSLVDTICQTIIDTNKTAPTAVFLAGGGSLIPNITANIAEKLNMDKNRVAIKSNAFLKNVKGDLKKLDNPMFVTPLGIAITTYTKGGYDFHSVTLNGEKIRIYQKDELNIGDVLTLGGIKAKALIGLSGNSLVYELNGKKFTEYGGMSKHGEILINGKEANIRSTVKAGDNITVSLGENGENAKITLMEIIDTSDYGDAQIDNSKISLNTKYTVNGENVDESYSINNYDIIKTTKITTLKDALKALNISEDNNFFKDDEKIFLDYIIKKDDVINVKPKENIPEIKEESIEDLPENFTGKIIAEDITYKTPIINVTVNGFTFPLSYRNDGTPPVFADATKFAQIDLKNPKGNIIVTLNGRPTSYTQPLIDGDIIEIGWEE